MSIRRKRMLTNKTKGTFNPFKEGTKRLKAGYKRIGNGLIKQVSTGLIQQF